MPHSDVFDAIIEWLRKIMWRHTFSKILKKHRDTPRNRYAGPYTEPLPPPLGVSRSDLDLCMPTGFIRMGWYGSGVNDPSAGSPTETLLRLLLPLNDKVQATSRR